jgi:hypothetical protein
MKRRSQAHGTARRFIAGLAGCAAMISVCAATQTASAQEIQVTGPLAGAPPVRQLRLHRAGKFEIAVGASFTLLDQYLRTAMPGGTLTHHFTDWLGLGVFGGYGLQYSTGLTDSLQTQVIPAYNCGQTPWTQTCRLTAVNLTHNNLSTDQLGHLTWFVAPQLVAIPFRGKISLFSSLFVDADIAIFAGAAFVGVKERQDCGEDDNGKALPASQQCSVQAAYGLASRVAIAPTFGLGLDFYPGNSFFGIGFEFRAFPFSWNTSGFDNHGGGNNSSFPDGNVNSADREFHFNTMATINVKVALPASIKTTQ